MQATHQPCMQLLAGHAQYVIPRWQRRYAWGPREIDTLLADLRSVGSRPDSSFQHYAGALLTFPEPGPAGAMAVHRVVDGQQRLVTVSLLYARLAELLGPDGQCGEWSRALIRDTRLFNAGSPGPVRKLRLQDRDEAEYAAALSSDPGNLAVGPVTAAWRHLDRVVAPEDVGVLIEGLARLRVVSIALGAGDDPQQIFESLNATGRPLTEGEQMKSWLLLGLPDGEQQKIHEEARLPLEDFLGSRYEPARPDRFLRDYLRMSAGSLVGIGQVYDTLRRHFVDRSLASNRHALCTRLRDHARQYGHLSGVRPHPVQAVETELRHLRTLGLDVHRPLTMRVLFEACAGKPQTGNPGNGWSPDLLRKALRLVSTWLTRVWLADRAGSGLNRAFAELAMLPGPSGGSARWSIGEGRLPVIAGAGSRLRTTRRCATGSAPGARTAARPDQVLGTNAETNAKHGWSVAMGGAWDPEDEESWPEAARWVVEQVRRVVQCATSARVMPG